jgi:hypothetical protein
MVTALAWACEGLETQGGSALACVLHMNSHLRMLNLSHTRAGPEVCLVVCEALSRNTTLRTLHLDSNPLGADGGRHLMWGLHSSRSLETLTMKGSTFASRGLVAHSAGFAAVNMQNPDGEYELDCGEPAQRAVARQLMVVNRKLGCRNVTACKVGGKAATLQALEDFLAGAAADAGGAVAFRFTSEVRQRRGRVGESLR